jgi:predicted nucleotidyltransferase
MCGTMSATARKSTLATGALSGEYGGMITDGSATRQSLRDFWPEIQKHGVNHLWIFGSRARGDDHADSDVDLLVDFVMPPNFDDFMGLKLQLEDHLGAKVDLLSLSACQPRFLKAIQPELLHVA